ncbi:serine/threonine protein kinase [Streptomyces sp. 6N223]|uniref:serine/threonine protein kinase n=1 Tax=Streptomyces sp. 6N223 TaxID=3457412 RepID=UPI003FD5D4E2
MDEKLRRAVGVHVLPADHDRAPSVLSAARSASLLGDPRFIQVLDAVEENGQVHVIHEWLPGATPLSTLLHTGPLDAHEAYVLASQVSEAMAAAHRESLSHLRLTPATVLRTGPCQYRIRGLAVDAALRGLTAPDPQRADTEAIGALLYAALTQRWPYPEGAYGLDGVIRGKGPREALATPDQVRAGVHRGLSDLAMRALVNNGATAATARQPCTTPADLVEELARLPRIPPADPTPSQLPTLQRTTYHPGGQTPGSGPAAQPHAPRPQRAAPTLPGRTGTALKWSVSALLIAALGLGSWQLADALMHGDSQAETTGPTAPPAEQNEPAQPEPLTIRDATDFDPFDDAAEENPEYVSGAIDADPATEWHTNNYYGPGFGNLKPGVGLVLDLGEAQKVRTLTVDVVGATGVEFRAASPGTTTMPTSLDDYAVIDRATGDFLRLRSEVPVETRFVLVWLTELPMGDDGNYRGRITGVTVSG